MKKYFLLYFILLLSLGSCETEEQNPNLQQIIKKEKINGFVQKGPFVSGTSILMNELNSELDQTGKIFTSTITNDLGLFELRNIELNSRFVEFTSTGFYFNEVSGEISISPLTLTSLSDIGDRNSININVLTHLEKRRVETLMKEGKTFSESKKQSRNELLSIFSVSLNNDSSFEEFDISKNTEEGAILLGISIILQGKRSVGQLTELLSRIQNDFGNNGKLDDNGILNSLRTMTLNLDFEVIRKNVESRYRQLNINTPVPDFDKYISTFLNTNKIKITIEGEGTVLEEVVFNPWAREYPNQTIINLHPLPREGWVFDSWGGDLDGTESPKNIIVDKDKNVTAKFKRKDYKINFTIIGEGTVEERVVTNPNGREYPFQTVVELNPIPKEGWVFESWGGDLIGTEFPKNITVDKEKNVTINFRQPIFRLGNNGITCICENVKVGEKGFINGVEYEVVDNLLLRQRRDQGINMTKLCTSLVTDLSRLFESKEFNQPINNWDVSNVTNMIGMFSNSTFNQPIEDWDVRNVLNMHEMFSSSNFNQPIGKWNVSNVRDMSRMFNFNSVFNQPIENWDVSKVTDMTFMFNQQIAGAYMPTPAFNQPLGNWNVSNVRNMSGMFANSAFNQPIGNWDVSNVTDMSVMFSQNSAFNQPLRNWDVSNVTNMDGMFFRSQFNQALSKWCVTKITSEPQSFSVDSPLTTENKPRWGTCDK